MALPAACTFDSAAAALSFPQLSALNSPLPSATRQTSPKAAPPPVAGRAKDRRQWGCDMDLETFFAKTPATLDEIRARVGYALARHPLCRHVQFDIISTPPPRTGGNWTITPPQVPPAPP